MTYDIIIGIDPDVEASGVATLSPRTKRIEATTMTLPALLDDLRRVRKISHVDGRCGGGGFVDHCPQLPFTAFRQQGGGG